VVKIYSNITKTRPITACVKYNLYPCFVTDSKANNNKSHLEDMKNEEVV